MPAPPPMKSLPFESAQRIVALPASELVIAFVAGHGVVEAGADQAVVAPEDQLEEILRVAGGSGMPQFQHIDVGVADRVDRLLARDQAIGVDRAERQAFGVVVEPADEILDAVLGVDADEVVVGDEDGAARGCERRRIEVREEALSNLQPGHLILLSVTARS